MKIARLSIYVTLVLSALLSACTGSETENTVKIGVIVPLSGNDGPLGDYSNKGVELAVDQQNAQGGLLGKKIELVVQDSESKPEKGLSIAKTMLENDKPFAIYSIISGVTLAIKPETEKSKTILMAAVGTDKFLEGGKYTFRNFFAATTTANQLTEFIKDSLHAKSLSLFYADNEYGKSVKEAISKESAEHGLKMGFSETFDPKSLNYKSQIAATVNRNTECLYVAGVGKSLGTMIKQIRESGYKGEIIGDPLIPFPDVYTSAGESLKGLKYLDFAFEPTSTQPNTAEFVTSFKKKFNEEPKNFSVISYEGMKLLFKAVEKTKSFDAQKLSDDLNTTEGYNGVFGKVSIAGNNFHYTFKPKEVK